MHLIKWFSVDDTNQGILNISHLIPAHDTFISAEAKQNQISALRGNPTLLWSCLWLKVNLSKLELVSVESICNIQLLANTFRCKVSYFPMKYLDLHLGASFRAKSICDEVIEKDCPIY